MKLKYHHPNYHTLSWIERELTTYFRYKDAPFKVCKNVEEIRALLRETLDFYENNSLIEVDVDDR